MKCPRCQSENFKTEDYEGVEIDRCQTCQGVWLDEEEILTIISEREKTFSEDQVAHVMESKKAGVPVCERTTKLKCPKCAAHMNSVNYGYDSGIIIDNCPSNHGTWLDPSELEKVQIYREKCEVLAEENMDDWLLLAEQNKEETAEKFRNTYRESSIIHRIGKLFGK